MNSVGPDASLYTPPVAAIAGAARILHRDHILGTSLDMIVVGGDAVLAQEALAGALAEINRLEPLLSGWHPHSELSRLNTAGSATVSPELFRVIEAAEAWRRDSDGAFDGRLGAVEALWRQAATEQSPPTPAALTQAVARSAADIGLDRATLRVDRPDGVVLALDGLAKGYVVDAALAAARRAAPGLAGLMIDIGGDIAVWGQGPGGAWRIGANNPHRPEDNGPPAAVIAISSGGIATSGAGRRDLTLGGERLGLRLLPASGAPARSVTSATVVADCAMNADALATAVSVLHPHDALALVERTRGAEALIFGEDGRRLRSSGWAQLAQAAPPPVRAPARVQDPAAKADVWPAGFVVAIDYTLPKPVAGRLFGAYVSIWVTDANNQPIRQVLLTGNDTNYIDQNFVWWRRYGRSAPKMVDAMSKPTRPAGHYTVVWDGKDQNGTRVGQGRYTIHVEAIREHGQHNYQAVPMNLSDTPAQATAPSGEEIQDITLAYGKRP